MEAKKVCKECGEKKPLSDFYSKAVDCRECARRKQRERNWKLRGVPMDHDLRNVIDDAIDGRCAICDRTPEEVGGKLVELSADHDHQSGMVRSLLCGNCNRGIGFLGDDPERLRIAADYIEFFRMANELVPDGAASIDTNLESGD